MATVLLDLTSRFRAAIGYAPAQTLYSVQPIPGGQYMPATKGAITYQPDNGSFENLQIKGNGYDLFFGGTPLTKSGETGNMFAPPPLITWRKAKNLVITAIDGADGEVAEWFGDGAWEIHMQGIVVDMVDHQFPLEKMETIRKLFEVPAPFEVSAPIFLKLGIHNIYFTDIEMTGVQGFQDTLMFSLNARSTKPQEFYINGEQ